MLRLVSTLFMATAVMVTAETATAQSAPLPPCAERTAASEAYLAGAEALRQARYNDAARKFGEADERCPHDVALDEAMRAVVRADNPILCMQLVERATRRGILPERRAELSTACGQRVGRLLVVCPGATCRASVDGAPVRLHEELPALVGRRIVDLSVDGGPVVPHAVEVRAGAVTRVPNAGSAAAAATPAPETAVGDADEGTEAESDGLHPAVFYVGVGLTAVAGSVLAWSAIDTSNRNDAFKDEPDPDTRQAGMDAQLRTNAMIGVTAAVAVGTAITALFTDWGGGDTGATATMVVDPRGRGVFAAWRATF
jgi:hypothetical protein